MGLNKSVKCSFNDDIRLRIKKYEPVYPARRELEVFEKEKHE
jgi:hypothetical protein